MCVKQAALNLQQVYDNFDPEDVYFICAIANYSQADDLAVLEEFYNLHELTFFMSGSDHLGQYSSDFGATFTVIGNCNVIIGQNGADAATGDLTQMIQDGMDSFEYLHLQAPIADMEMTINEENTIDLTQVFNDPQGNTITFTVEENTAPSVIDATVNGSDLTLQTGIASGIASIRLKAEVGERAIYVGFTVFVNVVSSVMVEEDFENDGATPDGWTEVIESGSTYWTYANGGYDGNPAAAHSGQYNASLYNGSFDPHATKLITPAYEMSEMLGARLEFFHAQALWSSDQDELEVYCRSSENDPWILIAEYRQDTPSWLKRIVDLPIDAFSDEFQIAFHGIAKYGYSVCIDDVSIIGYEMDINDIAQEKALNKVNFLTNYPNPFNPVTNVNFSIAEDGNVALYVYNTKGQLIKSLLNERMTAGSHSVIWNGTNNTGQSVSSGVYFCRIEAGTEAPVNRKMILMK